MYYLSFVHGMYISCTIHVHLVVSFALPFVPSVAPWSGAITARNMTLPYSSNVTWSRPFGINNGTTLNRTGSRSLKGSRTWKGGCSKAPPPKLARVHVRERVRNIPGGGFPVRDGHGSTMGDCPGGMNCHNVKLPTSLLSDKCPLEHNCNVHCLYITCTIRVQFIYIECTIICTFHHVHVMYIQ